MSVMNCCLQCDSCRSGSLTLQSSFGHVNSVQVLDNTMGWLKSMYDHNKKSMSEGWHICYQSDCTNFSGCRLRDNVTVPQQKNGYDCGVFACAIGSWYVLIMYLCSFLGQHYPCLCFSKVWSTELVSVKHGLVDRSHSLQVQIIWVCQILLTLTVKEVVSISIGMDDFDFDQRAIPLLRRLIMQVPLNLRVPCPHPYLTVTFV